MTALHITLAQINPVVGDIAGNLARIRAVRDQAPASTDLIVYPELALCGYPTEDLVLKPAFQRDVRAAVETLVRESAGTAIHLAISCPWKDGEHLYNALHLIGEGKIKGTVHKHHLPNYGVFDEKRLFKSGTPASPLTLKGHKIGLLICEDFWFPDVAGKLVKEGAEMLIVSNASPYAAGKHEMRLAQAQARIRENSLPLLYLNLWGGQDDIVFDGLSFILNEKGGTVLQARAFADDIHHTVWERAGNGHWLCLTDTIHARPGPEEEIYGALVAALRDYVRKNGFPGVILGLSGGIDSALSAAIAADALGHDAVRGVMMPSIYTSAESLEDAAESARLLRIRYDTVPIKDSVMALEAALAPLLPPHAPGIVHENLQSRARGVILMALSNATGAMVLSTGNKSEMATGYATLYGDMCGGYNALKDVYKTEVYKLAAWRNAEGTVIPARVMTKAPTAELRYNQTDQDTLPPYPVLDEILQSLIEKDRGIGETAKETGHARDLVARVDSLLTRAEYKRYQSAPGPKISARAFARERRYPLTNGYNEKK